MSNNINVINSNIVDAAYDVYWQDVADITNGHTPKPVLVISVDYEHNSPEDVQLHKMLEACKMEVGKYNLIKIGSDTRLAWHRLREQLDPKIIFLIGIIPVNLGISASFRLNEPNRFAGCIWLPTLGIAELEQNKEAKSQLWNNGMKPLFVDNPITQADGKK